MRVPASLLAAGLLLVSAPCFGLSPTHHSHTGHATLRHAELRSHRTERFLHHETVGMSAGRATQIQTALIKAGYLTGAPTGTWDGQSIAAMQKLQGDNGWQTKLTPDSRALIKLGLGPQQDEQAQQSTPATPLH